MRSVTVVKKKGFTGLKIKFGEASNEQLTFWHKDPSELAAIFEQFAIILQTQRNTTLKRAFAKSKRVR